ncbi:MAG: hypothetical protein LBI49_27060 [Nocardiopsaceae bacterium]|nr:hypothetical protein [Nocardiopsaceae bacterium]
MSEATRGKLTRPASGRAGTPTAAKDRNPARVLSVIALASIAAGVINLTAAATVGSTNAQNLTFFVVITVAQVGWGVVALVRAPRWWLALGALANLAVAAVWVVSRTAGLPAGPEAHVTLPAHFPDVLATILAIVAMVGAAALMIRGQGPAASATRSPFVTVAAAVVVGALTIGGVAAQISSWNSSSGGSSHSGSTSGSTGGGGGGGGTSGGGGNGGGGNGGGGGTSGGGSSGGGYGY